MANLEDIVKRGSERFNAGDVNGLLDLYTPDAELTSPGMNAKGREQIRGFTAAWLQGFPDAKITSKRYITVGSTVVEEGVFTGTHTGAFPTPMGDIPATGKRVEGPFVDIFDFEGDKVARDTLIFDRMLLMEQLGLMPTPAGSAA